MKRILISLIAVMSSLGADSLAQERRGAEIRCGENATQAEANLCTRREYQKADAELNKVYRQLMAGLAGFEGKDQQQLRRAQALWIQYRNANCESESSIYLGGSIRPAVYNSCLASVTQERTRRLAEFLFVTRQ